MRKRLVLLLMAIGMLGASVNTYAAELDLQEAEEEVSSEETELPLEEYGEALTGDPAEMEDGEQGDDSTETDELMEEELIQTGSGVEINEINFPDVNFREYVLTKIDGDQDRMLSEDEVKKVTSIAVEEGSSEGKIEDLKGIEYFTALEYLTVDENSLSGLDLSQNTALEELNCYGNQISSLDLGKNIALRSLNCSNNQISSLDLSQNTALKFLYCYGNDLKELDVSHNTVLNELNCKNNPLENLDVSMNANLGRLYCEKTLLKNLDVSHNINLQTLECRNNSISGLNVSKNAKLRELRGNGKIIISGRQIDIVQYDNAFDVSKASNLKDLDLNGNIFTISDGEDSGTYEYDCGGGFKITVTIESSEGDVEINEANFPDPSYREIVEDFYGKKTVLYGEKAAIKKKTIKETKRDGYLAVIGGNIKSLQGIEYFTELEEFHCYSNKELNSLDMSKNKALRVLDISDNNLSSLNVSQNTALTTLYCDNNNLSSLDVSQNTALTSLSCHHNNLGSLDLSQNMVLTSLTCHAQSIETDNVSINMAQYDNKFDPDRVRGLKELTLNGAVFKLTEGTTGKYSYLCNDKNLMEVTIKYNGESLPTPADQPSPKPTASPSSSWPFSDVAVKPGNWKYDNIKFVNEKGIMTGVTSTEFQPDEPLTRAQFASVIYRMAGSPQVTYQSIFTDVPAGKWYSSAIIWAYENKIVAGLGDGRYGINDNITREQMARMLMEYARVQGYDISAREDFGKFADASQVSKWALENMRWAVGSGIISGSTKDGKYYMNPKGQATRAECAVMLTKFMEKY